MSATYQQITTAEFEELLDQIGTWELANVRNVDENVYDIPMSDDVAIRVFSTIEEGSSRGSGKDAIRTVLWHHGANKPVGGRSKTLRIGPSESNPHGWKANLLPKIVDMMANWEDEVGDECDECGGVMQKRNGKYGEFLGCSNFPNCRHTESL